MSAPKSKRGECKFSQEQARQHACLAKPTSDNHKARCMNDTNHNTQHHLVGAHLALVSSSQCNGPVVMLNAPG